MLAHHSISSQNNPIYVRSSQTEAGLKYLCESSAGGGQGNPLTNIIFPVVIDKALKAAESNNVEPRAQQDDIHLWGDPDEIFGEDGTLARLLADLKAVGLDPNLTKFQLLGTTPDACANKPAWLTETFIITDPLEAARVAEAEAAAKDAAAAAKAAPPEEADEANAAAATAKEAAKAARDAVPERLRAKGVWTCGAAIGDDAYVTHKLKELEVKLCGSGTDADKGELLTIASELAAADPHAAHAAIQYSLQARVDWVMSVHLPEETRSLAAAVDRTLRTCYALCFGADPLDPNGLSESQEDRAFVHDRFALPVRLGGGGFRPTAERALFLNTLNNVAPQLLATERTRGLWPSLDSVFGAGSFNADNAATRWDAFYASGSRFALALRSEWGRVQQARKDAIIAAGLPTPPTDTVLDASASSFGHKVEKLHRKVFKEIRSYRRLGIHARACELPRDDPRRRAFLGAAEDKVSLQLFTGTPTRHCRFTTREYHSSVQNALGLPQSRLKSILGRPITNNPNCPTARVDKYGHSLKTVTGVKHDGIRRLHDLLVNLLSKWLRRAQITHMGGVGGYKRTCKGLFTEVLNHLPSLDPNSPTYAEDLRFRQGIIPDLLLDVTSIDLPENVAKMLGDCTLADMKTLAPGTVYSEPASTTPSHAVEKRQKQVSPAYHAAARSLDAELGSQPGLPGPVESELNTYNSGNVLGLVAGAYAELSSAFHAIIDLIASQLADEHLQFFDIDHGMCKSIFLQQVRRSLGLALHRGWAKLMLDRCRDLVQHPNQPRSMVSEATDEDDEEAHAFYHHTRPSGHEG